MLVIERLQLGPMANFVYLVADGDSRECAVVDPTWDVPAILAAAASGLATREVIPPPPDQPHLIKTRVSP
ncbi:MAG: hypothetical protein HY554_06015 [Elusimicrobia bacterium]|nr:hypothetical protein [Elusimicrobiota bacterium]